MRLSSPSSTPPTSFSLLPYDLVLNCLAYVSRIHYPTLSLVSKSFRSLVASSELDATRSRIGKTENFIYVCLNLNKKNPKPRWFMLSLIPKQQKLIPIPSCPYQHLIRSTVLSIGSEIYVIGGKVDGNRSKKVFLLDCKSHQWRELPDMHVRRREAAADVFDGKVHVIGGCKSPNTKNWGEVYDPKKQTWEPISPTTLDLTVQKNLVPRRLVMGGKVYIEGLHCERLYFQKHVCLVEIENVFCEIMLVYTGYLHWRHVNTGLGYTKVTGLERLPKFPNHHLVAISSNGIRRVSIWWTSAKAPCKGCHRSKTGECKTEIWCAEVSFERRALRELQGFVEWCKNVLTLDGCDPLSNFFMDSARVTH